jgi:hypothetical protein
MSKIRMFMAEVEGDAAVLSALETLSSAFGNSAKPPAAPAELPRAQEAAPLALPEPAAAAIEKPEPQAR